MTEKNGKNRVKINVHLVKKSSLSCRNQSDFTAFVTFHIGSSCALEDPFSPHDTHTWTRRMGHTGIKEKRPKWKLAEQDRQKFYDNQL